MLVLFDSYLGFCVSSTASSRVMCSGFMKTRRNLQMSLCALSASAVMASMAESGSSLNSVGTCAIG